MRIALIVLLACHAAAVDLVDTVTVGDHAVELHLPAGHAVIRGILLHAGVHTLSADDRWGEFCRAYGWAHVAVGGDPIEPDLAAAVGAALTQALAGWADRLKRPELRHCPIAAIASTHSMPRAATALAMPDRLLAACQANHAEDPARLAGAAPLLLTFGGDGAAAEEVTTWNSLAGAARSRGLPWTVAVQPGRSAFANTAVLAVPWFLAIHQARAATGDPAKGPLTLAAIAPESGWLGNPAGGSDPRVAPAAEYPDDRAAAVWLPSAAVAQVWAALVATPRAALTIPGAEEALPDDSGEAELQAFAAAGATLTLAAKPVDEVRFRSVSFHVGDRLLGSTNNPPWSFAWTAPSPGLHPVHIRCELADGSHGRSRPALVIVRQPADGRK